MQVPPPKPASVVFKQKLIVPLSPAGKVQHCLYPVSVQSVFVVHRRTTLVPGQLLLGAVAHAVPAAHATTVSVVQLAVVPVEVVVKQHTGAAAVVQLAGDSQAGPFPASAAASSVPPLLLPPPLLLLPPPPLLLPPPPLLLPPPSGAGGDVVVLLLQAARPTERATDTK
jgi:hypothetical protein